MPRNWGRQKGENSIRPAPFSIERRWRKGRCKAPLHLAARQHRLALRHRHIGPAHDRAARDIAEQHDFVCETDRQGALRQASLGRHELAPHRIATFAVERLASAQCPFCDGYDIGAEAPSLTGRLAA